MLVSVCVVAAALLTTQLMGLYDSQDPETFERQSLDPLTTDARLAPLTQSDPKFDTERRPQIPATTPSPAAERPVARIVAAVATASGDGAAVRLELYEDRDQGEPIATKFTDPSDGSAVFEGLSPGPFLLRTSELPASQFPPLSSPGQVFMSHPTCFDTPLTAEAGQNLIRIQLAAAARIRGYVLDEDGDGVAGALVAAQLQQSNPRVYKDFYCETDERGYYEIVCCPALWRVSVSFRADHEMHGYARPFPRDLTIDSPGVQRADFSISMDGATIGGRVIDSEGEPVAGLEVLCYYKPERDRGASVEPMPVFTMRDSAQRTETMDDGRFTLRGLPGRRVRVIVGAEDYRPVGHGRLGMRGPLRTIQLRPDQHHPLGDLTVHRSRPFHVVGRVVARSASGRDDLELVAVLQKGPRRDRVKEQRIPLAAEGRHFRFEWSCETPEERVLLELRGPSGLLDHDVVLPVPEGLLNVALEAP